MCVLTVKAQPSQPFGQLSRVFMAITRDESHLYEAERTQRKLTTIVIKTNLLVKLPPKKRGASLWLCSCGSDAPGKAVRSE